MKNTHILIMCLALGLLTACQEVSPGLPRKSAEETEREKAQAISRINIEVIDEKQVKEAAVSAATVPQEDEKPVIPQDAKEMTVTEGGFRPDSIKTKVGQTLLISNSLDKQINLYTTSDGDKSCEVLGPTIEIPGGQSKQIDLNKPFQCTIINQENTDQKAIVKVE